MEPDGMREAVAARYGRTPATRRRRIVLAVAAGVAVLAVVAAWVVWVGLSAPHAAFTTRDLAHRIQPDGSIDVRFEVTAEPGTAVSCALQALNDRFAIVGWKVVDLPPAERRTRSFEVGLRTTEQPTTGLIYRCWLT